MFAWALGGSLQKGVLVKQALWSGTGRNMRPLLLTRPPVHKGAISALGPRQIYPTRPLLAPNLLANESIGVSFWWMVGT